MNSILQILNTLKQTARHVEYHNNIGQTNSILIEFKFPLDDIINLQNCDLKLNTNIEFYMVLVMTYY